MKRTWWTVFLVTITLFACAAVLSCGDDDDDDDDDDDAGGGDDDGNDDDGEDDYRDAIPSRVSLMLTIPGAEYEDSALKAVGDNAKYYEDTVQFTREVNGHILGFLSIIDEITSYPPSDQDGAVYTWGPWMDTGLDMVENLFVMEKVDDNIYDYALRWRAKDTDDAWTDIWVGHVESSIDTVRHGEGNFSIDFDAAQELDWTVEESGMIRTDYDTINDGRRITIDYIDFFVEGEDMPGPVNAQYLYHNRADNTGSFLFDWLTDIHWDEYGGELYPEFEHAWFYTRWQSNGTGRTDLIVTDGDLPDIDVGGFFIEEFLSSECWDNSFHRTYYTESLTLDNGDSWQDPDWDFPEGDEDDCAFEQEWPEVK